MPVRFGGRGKACLCPYPYLSPGFQPWEPSPERRALKGRQIEHPNNAAKVSNFRTSQLRTLFLRNDRCEFHLASLSHLQGESFIIKFPGLKPWAESYNPFGVG
jgi:hypothetical protein